MLAWYCRKLFPIAQETLDSFPFLTLLLNVGLQAVQQEAGCGARPEYPVQAAVQASVANATALVQRALPQYQSRHKLTQVTLKLHQQHPEQLCGDVPEHLARILEDPSARSEFITSSAKPLLACDAVLLASVCVRPGCTLVVISLNVQRWVQALLGAEQLQALQGQQGPEAGGQGDEPPLQITAQCHQSITHFQWDRDQQVWGSTPLPLP
ncbi:hypothetical protein HaLaN_29260, partial [Haematococcus lacustris]